MANNPFGGGSLASTGGSSSGKGSVNVGGSQVISPLAIPELAKLFQNTQQQIPTREELPSLQDMIAGGMNSPLLQLVLGPALERLKAPQQQQQQNLTEAARAAGSLRSSNYGQDFNKLLVNQGQQTNDLMGQVIQQVLGQLLQGQLQEQRNQFLPAESLTNLLRASAPSVSRGGATATSGWENIPPSLGLGTPMQSDITAALTGRPSAGGGGVSGGTPTMSPPPTPSTATGTAPPQYVDPFAGGYGAIDSPYVSPGGQPGGAAYQHDYSEWVPQVTEGWW